ncbi:MAG: hypothetical protein GEV03_09465 [Streptosporangiales bacterium]|nr:hypothetical protein [Streptosporangiales bacterium]
MAAALRRRAERGRPVCAYVYDLTVLRDQVRRLREALPSWCEVYYAIKANADPAVVRAVAPLVDGFEVASLGELRQVREATGGLGAPPRAVFSGPGKTDADIEGALRSGIELLNVEGTTELHRVQWIAERLGVRVPVALRVNPGHRVLSGSHLMGGTPSQFGIEEAQLPGAVASVGTLPALDLRGLHFHAASNNLHADAHARYVEWCLRVIAEVEAEHGVRLPILDVGGGLGVDYRRGPGFDLRDFGRRLGELPPPNGRRVVLEPGRYLAAGCGYYAAEVLDLKRNHGQYFAVVRGGIHHFRLPSTPHAGEHGHPFAVVPVEAWDYPFPRPQVEGAPVTVAGELCTPRDVLARDTWVDRLRGGDIVVFPLAGAYGWEISHHDFLAHPHPDRIVLDD